MADQRRLLQHGIRLESLFLAARVGNISLAPTRFAQANAAESLRSVAPCP